jgi:META domain
MSGGWRLVTAYVTVVMALCSQQPCLANEGAFPFGRELILDAAPIRGSKRIPIIEIAESGAASIQLWCASMHGQATVGADTITITPGDAQPAQCAPERQSRDQDLLAALMQVTGWRRSGDVIEFVGATTLRFRLMTN